MRSAAAELNAPNSPAARTAVGCTDGLGRRDNPPPSRINGKPNPEYNRWYHERHKQQAKQRRQENREHIKSYMTEYRSKNKTELQAWARDWWSKNRKTAIAKHKSWLKIKGREYLAARNKKAKSRMIETLPDHYLHQCQEMPLGSLPPQYLETLRVNIKLKRLCRNQKTSTNSATNYSTHTTA